jgi:hypothetical protein
VTPAQWIIAGSFTVFGVVMMVFFWCALVLSSDLDDAEEKAEEESK